MKKVILTLSLLLAAVVLISCGGSRGNPKEFLAEKSTHISKKTPIYLISEKEDLGLGECIIYDLFNKGYKIEPKSSIDDPSIDPNGVVLRYTFHKRFSSGSFHVIFTGVNIQIFYPKNNLVGNYNWLRKYNKANSTEAIAEEFAVHLESMQ